MKRTILLIAGLAAAVALAACNKAEETAQQTPPPAPPEAAAPVATAEAPSPHGAQMGQGGHPGGPISAATEVDLSGIVKVDGGNTIAEIYERKGDLAGQEVVFRGKVVKFNAGIMGKNWIHLQDGTGGEGTNDLTVTTDGFAEVGDTVVIRGTAALDKDFGYGYKYGLIVEDAQVTVE